MNKVLRPIISLGLLVGALVPLAHAEDYTIDPTHSTVGFKIRHLGISSVSGRFSDFQGTFSYDPKNVAQSKAEALIKVGSVNTDQAKRDDHLRAPDFFDAAKFQEMKFKSKEVKVVSPTSFQLVGDLTIRDVTKPVTMDVSYEGAATDPWGNARAAFTATTKINRKDYGLVWNKVIETGALVVGDEVSINLEVEGIVAKKDVEKK